MKFYSGFSLKNESHFFMDYIKESEYSISGFSYGAIKAFRDVSEELKKGKRVDTLQLFSPAFFQSKSSKFKRLQTLAYTKSRNLYLKNFIDECFYPHEKRYTQHCETTAEELEELLNFEWIPSALKALTDKGVAIEVYLGSNDRIIDTKEAREFFLDAATVTYIKSANHFLQIN